MSRENRLQGNRLLAGFGRRLDQSDFRGARRRPAGLEPLESIAIPIDSDKRLGLQRFNPPRRSIVTVT